MANNESKLKQLVNISYNRRSTENLNKDSLIMSHLAETFSFTTSQQQRLQKVQLLTVKARLLLLRQAEQNNNELSSSTTSSSDKIIFENVNLEVVASVLSDTYKMRFESDTSISERFNLQLPNGNFARLKQVLKSEYGIILQETEKKIEYMYIDFQK